MADQKKEVIGRVTLLDVRLSFADLWTPKSLRRADGSMSDPKFSANFLISKDGVNARTGEKLRGKYKGKIMPIMAALKAAKLDAMIRKLGESDAQKKKVKPENYAIKDGDLENWDGYADHWYASSNNSIQPKIVGKDKRALEARDGIPYSGCYVNAVITLWCQLPGQGQDGQPKPLAVWGSLEAIQFVADGERFGAAPVDVDEEFDDITDADDQIDGDDEDEDDVL